MQKKILILLLICAPMFGIVTVGRDTSYVKQGADTLIKKKLTDQDMSNVHMSHVKMNADRGKVTREFAENKIEDAFSAIYHTNYWMGAKSRSGQGSSLVSTDIIRNELPVLCDTFHVRSFLDVGCGDFYWMRTVNLKKCEYIGVDIVPEMIAKNRANYEDATHHFLCLNSTKDPLPKADFIFCRDVIAHLSFKDACNLLRNLKASGSKFLMITTHLNATRNQDIHSGAHFPSNLTVAPFNLPQPLVLIEETCAERATSAQGKAMGIWLLQDVDLDCLEH